MKKFLALIGSVVLAAVMAVSMAACSQGMQRVKVLDVQLTCEQYGYCVSKDNAEIMEEVNSLIGLLCGSEAFNPEDSQSGADAEGVAYDLNGDGTAENVTFKILYEAVQNDEAGDIGEVATSVPAGADRNDYLVVATNAEFPPFESMVGDRFAGIDMHIAKMLAQRLGRELVIKNMEFDVVITDVENGASDIGMAGLTINRGREEVVTFSKGYYMTTQRIAILESDTVFDGCETEEEIVAKINSELKGEAAGGAIGQTGFFYIIGSTDFEFAGFPDINARSYDTVALAVRDLANGKVRFVVADRDTLNDAVEEMNTLVQE